METGLVSRITAGFDQCLKLNAQKRKQMYKKDFCALDYSNEGQISPSLTFLPDYTPIRSSQMYSMSETPKIRSKQKQILHKENKACYQDNYEFYDNENIHFDFNSFNTGFTFITIKIL